MFKENDELGNLIVIAFIGGIVLIPLLLIGGLFMKTKKIVVFSFIYWLNTEKPRHHKSPPLTGIDAEIYQLGIDSAIKSGKISESSLTFEEQEK